MCTLRLAHATTNQKKKQKIINWIETAGTYETRQWRTKNLNYIIWWYHDNYNLFKFVQENVCQLILLQRISPIWAGFHLRTLQPHIKWMNCNFHADDDGAAVGRISCQLKFGFSSWVRLTSRLQYRNFDIIEFHGETLHLTSRHNGTNQLQLDGVPSKRVSYKRPITEMNRLIKLCMKRNAHNRMSPAKWTETGRRYTRTRSLKQFICYRKIEFVFKLVRIKFFCSKLI